jgi:hypothetical protein
MRCSAITCLLHMLLMARDYGNVQEIPLMLEFKKNGSLEKDSEEKDIRLFSGFRFTSHSSGYDNNERNRIFCSSIMLI